MAAKRNRKRSFARQVVALVVFVIALFAARSSLADHYRVPTGSMTPTVVAGDHILVDKAAYGLRIPFTRDYAMKFGGPERGDVVVLRSPENGMTLLKRVVAVPGDVVMVMHGRLWLNGAPVPVSRGPNGPRELLPEGRHGIRLTHDGGPDFGPSTVPPHHYLVLGDNRGNSHDGRAFGFVDRDAIIGKAFAVYYRHGDLTWRHL